MSKIVTKRKVVSGTGALSSAILEVLSDSVPGVGDDIQEGFVKGSEWSRVDAEDVEIERYRCTDNALGAAVWTAINRAGCLVIKAASNPSVNDDELQGYRVGDRWLNVATGSEKVLTDKTAGAAVWTTVGGVTLTECAFAAIRNTPQNITSGNANPVEFNSEYYDLGNNYDDATATFTAPVRGIYHFDFNVKVTAVSSAGEFGQQTYLAVNSMPAAYGAGPDKFLPNTNNITLAGGIDILLEAGDDVQVMHYNIDSDQTCDVVGSRLSGHLVKEVPA